MQIDLLLGSLVQVWSLESFAVSKTLEVLFVPELLKCVGEDAEVDYSCGKCVKRFGRKGRACAHLRTHLGNKIFTCAVPSCGRKYSNMNDVMTYFKKHPSSATTKLDDATQQFAYSISRYGVPDPIGLWPMMTTGRRSCSKRFWKVLQNWPKLFTIVPFET